MTFYSFFLTKENKPINIKSINTIVMCVSAGTLCDDARNIIQTKVTMIIKRLNIIENRVFIYAFFKDYC